MWRVILESLEKWSRTAVVSVVSTSLIVMSMALPSTVEAAEFGRLGVHFQVYGEPHEEDNPLYINVVPLTYEHPLAKHMTLKVGTIASLRISDGVSLGNVGAKAGLPFYLSAIEESRMRGFFVGPLVQASRNFYTEEIVVSSAIDLGYSFYIGQRLSMSLGGEVGVSAFFLNGETALRPHFGPGIYLYF